MKIIFLSAMLACLLGVSAQTVSIDGEIRPRAKYRDGYFKPLLETSDPGVFAIQRTRLNLAYRMRLLLQIMGRK